MKVNIVIPFLFFTAMIAACKKDTFHRTVEEVKGFESDAFIKFYNATVGTPVANVYLEDNKMSASLLGYTNLLPSSTTYAAIAAGGRNIKIKDTNQVSPKLSLNIITTLEKGKFYSVFLYDTVTKAKYQVVEDLIQEPADTSARIRFANLVYNSTTTPNVDIYSQNLQRNVFTNIPREQVTPFIDHPSKKADTFYIRATGTTTNLVTNGTTNSTIFTPGVHRHYTIIFRGRYGLTGTGTTARALTFMTNF
ncbi:MAG TPA: DUF4397 domain-containing protein [Flavitalea sp.]|nr:DUF4397 domain-containing protein [Flavitalea sp.]